MSDPVSELRGAVSEAAADLRGDGPLDDAKLDRPPRPDFGDYSTNAAMLLAPTLGEPPRAIAERLGETLGERLGAAVERVEVAGPGLPQPVHDRRLVPRLAGRRCAPPASASAPAHAGERVQVEFVSANPTGPITVAAGAPRRLRRLAGAHPRAGRQHRRARVLRQRRRHPGAQVRRVDPRAGAGGGAGGVPGRLRRRAGRADRGRGRRRPGRARPARHRADARGDRAHAASASACSMDRFFSERSLLRVGRGRAGARQARGRVRVRGRAVAADHGPGRRQGPRAAPVDRRAGLLRARTSPTTPTSSRAATTA